MGIFYSKYFSGMSVRLITPGEGSEKLEGFVCAFDKSVHSGVCIKVLCRVLLIMQYLREPVFFFNG